MRTPARSALAGLTVLMVSFPPAQAQQQQQQQPPAGAPFQLNPIDQAFLDQLLDNWELESGKIKTFRCEFERLDYDPVFAPAPGVPFSRDHGELSYAKPDKGSFKITEVRRWKANPVPPGRQTPQQQQGQWVVDANVIGEHWVCDGENVHEYRQQQKLHIVRPIPPDMQGKAIVDGPLPFLFGAEAEKLKDRYFLKVEQQPDPNQIWLRAYPKFQADKANYDWVRLSLDRKSLLPIAMEVHLPNRSRHTYIFDQDTITVNGHFDMIKNMFKAPGTPFGWKRVVQNGVAQANPPQRLPKR